MSNLKRKNSKCSVEIESNEYNLPKIPQNLIDKRKSSKMQGKKMTNRLFDLEEKNEEENSEEEEEDIQNISFSLSNCDDMNDFLDNFSNKSDEKIEIEYESTTNEEGFEIIEEFIRENTKQILNSKKGFDEDVKKMTTEFYSDLVKNLNITKDIKKRPHYLDKTKNSNYLTKSESLTSDEHNTKFKNDLVGQTLENRPSDVGQSYGFGKIFSITSKNKSISGDKNSSQSIPEEDEDDKIINIKKKRSIRIEEEK